jgi:Fe-S oxidoreductase
MNPKIKSAFRDTKAYYCLECGKCTSACPVSLRFSEFSPRLSVKKALLGFEEDLLSDENIWECLTCNLCNDVCMSDVKIPEFIRSVREEAILVDNKGCASHCEVPHAVSRLMTNPGLNQDRLNWISKDLKFLKGSGEYLLWTGCAPYFKTVFSEFDSAVDIPHAALKILNFFDIEPVILANEKCCGHDMLWMGQNETFEKLRKQNTESIEKAKAQKIITTCAEGFYTLKNYYKLDAEVIHISQFLSDKIENNGVELKKLNMGSVTYHDPCRLGRYAGVYDEPRKILDAIPGIDLVEMEKNRHRSPCCGVSAWMNCNDFSKEMRADKLKMAKETGSDTLITSCPKCRIHLRCYTSNEHVIPQINMEIQDLTVLVAKSLGLNGKKKVRK